MGIECARPGTQSYQYEQADASVLMLDPSLQPATSTHAGWTCASRCSTNRACISASTGAKFAVTIPAATAAKVRTAIPQASPARVCWSRCPLADCAVALGPFVHLIAPLLLLSIHLCITSTSHSSASPTHPPVSPVRVQPDASLHQHALESWRHTCINHSRPRVAPAISWLRIFISIPSPYIRWPRPSAASGSAHHLACINQSSGQRDSDRGEA